MHLNTHSKIENLWQIFHKKNIYIYIHSVVLTVFICLKLQIEASHLWAQAVVICLCTIFNRTANGECNSAQSHPYIHLYSVDAKRRYQSTGC